MRVRVQSANSSVEDFLCDTLLCSFVLINIFCASCFLTFVFSGVVLLIPSSSPRAFFRIIVYHVYPSH